MTIRLYFITRLGQSGLEIHTDIINISHWLEIQPAKATLKFLYVDCCILNDFTGT